MKPLLNLPVGVLPGKSIPQGGKLTFGASLGKKLLFPTSTVESPNTKTAGETAAVVSVERAAMNKLRRRKVVVFFAIGNELKVVIATWLVPAIYKIWRRDCFYSKLHVGQN